ncbi:DUF4167 domain-containing protein [Mesorhizobium sp. CAU 1741]|uniref:DUF4167 domain-containing protein n=1 Tax=Mesorhizobium sp. CAU 1741 TaxID=3140366 RepID=UPI00325BED96
MRPQQNRRMRGRGGSNNNNNNNNNNGGRKGPNPLTRSYESNGPDVKIRGSAQQIAEKYTTLARDAQSSGDRVMAENYLQHAEHYNRIIMAAQAQMPQPQQRDNRDDDDMDDDGDEGGGNNQPNSGEQDRQQHQHARSDGSGPQPVIEGVPAEVALNQQGNSGQESRDDAPRSENAPRGRAKAKTEADNGDDTEEAQAAPRKPRRPRRPRVKAGEDGAAPNEEEPSSGSDEPVTEAAQ